MASSVNIAPIQTVSPARSAPSTQAPTPAAFASQAADRVLGAPTQAGTVTTSSPASTPAPAAVLQYARDREGTVEGNGECFTLADNALRANGFKSASDYGRVTPNADYRWGQPVALNQSQPGDVLQFRNYSNTTRTTQSDGSWSEESQSRPHHTAVVVANDGQGNITVLEQNAPEGSPVTTRVLHFGNGTTENPDGSTTTQRTRGTVRAYHPEPRS